MLKRLPMTLTLIALLLAGFLVVIWHLFSLRFDAGDVYPPYSTLRSDPLGTRALYESLENVPGVSVSRWIDPRPRMPKVQPDGTTFFILGLDSSSLRYISETDSEVMDIFLRNGGRVVLALYPQQGKSWFEEEGRKRAREKAEKEKTARQKRKEAREKKKEPEDAEPERKSKKRPWEKDEGPKFVNLREHWDFKTEVYDMPKNEDGESQFVEAKKEVDAAKELPLKVAWHSGLVLSKLGTNWHALYQWHDSPVIAERSWGKGSIVLCTDTYLFSNEALKLHREPVFLSWVISNSRDIYFNETHLGIAEDPGVASLIRKYRLHGLVFALLVLAGLFIWRNSLSLVPPEEAAEGTSAAIAGRDAASGFLNLLHRTIAPAEILGVAMKEWKRTMRGASASRAEKIARMERLVNEHSLSKKISPVETYRQLMRIWKERR